MVTAFGRIEERLSFFFAANEVTTNAKKKAIFLIVVGASTYKLLQGLVAPDKPGDKSYEELVEN